MKVFEKPENKPENRQNNLEMLKRYKNWKNRKKGKKQKKWQFNLYVHELIRMESFKKGGKF